MVDVKPRAVKQHRGIPFGYGPKYVFGGEGPVGFVWLLQSHGPTGTASAKPIDKQADGLGLALGHDFLQPGSSAFRKTKQSCIRHANLLAVPAGLALATHRPNQ